MSLYREVRGGRRLAVAAAVLALAAGLGGGFALGRATSGTPGLEAQVRGVQRDTRAVLDALDVLSIEYGQAPSERAASTSDLERARRGFAAVQDDLALLDPEATRAAEAGFAGLERAVGAGSPTAAVRGQLAALGERLRTAARLR